MQLGEELNPGRTKSLLESRFLALAFIGSMHVALATTSSTVAPVAPQTITNDQYVYYAAENGAGERFRTATAFMDTGDGFSAVNVNTDDISFDVTPSDSFVLSGSERLVVGITGTKSGTVFNVPIEAVGGTTCVDDLCQDESNLEYRFAHIEPQTTTSIRIDLRKMCQDLGNLTDTDDCDAGLPFAASDKKSITLKFYIGKMSSSSATSFDAGTDQLVKSLTLVFQNTKPSISSSSCSPQLDQIYFPGDGEILVNTSAISGTSGGAPIQKLVVLANAQTGTFQDPNAAYSLEQQYNLVSRLAYRSGNQIMGGFVNTTNGSDNTYAMGFALRDAAGIVAPLSGCGFTNVQTSKIEGFLNESKCFIATAAAGTTVHPGVKLLRAFRDQVLLRHEFGKSFVKMYERFSPRVAHWIFHKPWARFPVLLALLPIQFFAWLFLHPFFILGLAVPLLFIFLPRKSFFLCVLFFGAQTLEARAETTATPFIDRIKKNMPKEEPSPSIIDQVKADEPAIPKGSSQTPTIDRIKRHLPPMTDSTASIEEEKKRLLEKENAENPPKSLIGDVKAGVHHFPPRAETPPPKFGTSLAIGVTQNRAITNAGGGTSQSFSNIYGSNWAPDARMKFEYEPFRSESFGSIGIVAGAGFSSFKGKGVFQYTLRNPSTHEDFGATSKTETRFSMVPLMLGGSIRFNLLSFLRPYAILGPSSTIYWESRTDNKPSGRGVTHGVEGSVGAAFLLNSFSSSNSRDLYDSHGITHFSIICEYNQIKSLSGKVHFDVSGFMAGLSFEY